MPRVWFHLIATTYGSWLPGDPRGFRTWQHREHVEGDYNNPPPAGECDARHRHAKEMMDGEPIVIPTELLEVVGNALREQLVSHGGRVLAIAVCGQHVHVQVELDDGDARVPLGVAKMHAWFALRDLGWKQKLWGKRCKVVRIKDRSHQKNVYQYIVNHRREGGWVWSELEQVEETEGT